MSKERKEIAGNLFGDGVGPGEEMREEGEIEDEKRKRAWTSREFLKGLASASLAAEKEKSESNASSCNP